MIIFSSPHDALMACESGMGCDSLNIGNINYTYGRKQVTPSISLSKDDVDDIRSLLKHGVKMDVRCVPREKPLDIMDVIDDYLRMDDDDAGNG